MEQCFLSHPSNSEPSKLLVLGLPMMAVVQAAASRRLSIAEAYDTDVHPFDLELVVAPVQFALVIGIPTGAEYLKGLLSSYRRHADVERSERQAAGDYAGMAIWLDTWQRSDVIFRVADSLSRSYGQPG